jgi:hypothetical protein
MHRPVSLLLICSLLLSGCGGGDASAAPTGSTAPTPAAASQVPVSAAPEESPASTPEQTPEMTPEATPEPTPEPTPTPAPTPAAYGPARVAALAPFEKWSAGPRGTIPRDQPVGVPSGLVVPWAASVPIADFEGLLDYYKVNVGFANQPAVSAFALGKTQPDLSTSQKGGDFIVLTAPVMETGVISVMRLSTGVRIWSYTTDKRCATSYTEPCERLVAWDLDARAGILWFSVGTYTGELVVRRVILSGSTGSDKIVFTAQRPWGASWADRDHTVNFAHDINEAGRFWMVWCGPKTDGTICSFWTIAPGKDEMSKILTVDNNAAALCRILGVDGKRAIVVSIKHDQSCPKFDSTYAGAGAAVVDFATRKVSVYLADDKDNPANLVHPIAVRTADGMRLVYLADDKGSPPALKSFDPATGKTVVLPFTIVKRALIDMTVMDALAPDPATFVDGAVLLVPSRVKKGWPASGEFLLPSTAYWPFVIDALTGLCAPVVLGTDGMQDPKPPETK